MPLYEFSCSSCGHVFEELIFRQTEIEEVVCPKCQTPKVKQLMSTFSSSASGSPPPGPAGGGCGPGSFS